MDEDWRSAGFGLYVHWPFCAAKCPYCDFNSHVVSHIDQRLWAKALATEVARIAEKTPDRVLQSIFFGGGTPSLMAPDTVETILEAARTGWIWANDIEITLEANPTSVETGRFASYADAGVNRVSLGVQALRDDDLKRLGRAHSASEAIAAFDLARRHFDRVSFDLIYARQGQSMHAWREELQEALSMAADHLSLYQLTVEEGTAFWERQARGGLKGLPGEDLAADMYELTQDLCADAGLPAYEISNHALPGAESRHNLIYWRYGDWAGVGPGAHGRISMGQKRFGTEALKAPGAWMTSIETNDASTWEALSKQDIADEHLIMGLRLVEGLDLERFLWLRNRDTPPPVMGHLQDDGLIWLDQSRFGATARGRLVLNALISELTSV